MFCLSFWQYLTGLPDFAEVYGFIGSVFDPDTNGHVQKLKEMDPINFETVSWLLEWNLLSYTLILYSYRSNCKDET